MKNIRLLSFTIILFALNNSTAQDWERIWIPVIENGANLLYPNGGGMNAPQYSTGDLNFDGKKDVLVFDRVGGVILPFIGDGIPGSTVYNFEPDLRKRFPKMEQWCRAVDFNQDGLLDLFTYTFDGGGDHIRVFKGRNNGGTYAFDRMSFARGTEEVLYYISSSSNPIPIRVAKVDIPAVEDIDGDGDLDILTFSLGGGTVEYYRNESIERGFGLDSLIFDLEETCWGNFYESGFSNTVSLSGDPDTCALSFGFNGGAQPRHAGSTIATIDNDNDGDFEVVLGDISFPNLVMLINGGTPIRAHMVSQDTNYPSNSTSVDLDIFPAAFFLDLNNDDKLDMVVAPNSTFNENRKASWFYVNEGTQGNPIFEFQKEDLFVGEMVDVGSDAVPAFFDFNGDGLQDILVGNNTFYNPLGKDPRLILFVNTGTATNPVFTITDEDYLGFSAFGDNNDFDFAPAFGDMDSDGDNDLLVGVKEGTFIYCENTAGAGNPVEFGAPVLEYMDLDVQQHAVPQLIDLNRDGLMDIISGERQGRIRYYQNIGSPGNPLFEPDVFQSPNQPFLGDVLTINPGDLTTNGYSAPYFFDQDGEYLLLAGSYASGIQLYDQIDGNLTSEFNQVQLALTGGIYEGWRSAIDMADLNNNGFLDLVIGNERGGIAFFETPFKSGITSINQVRSDVVHLFPNPTYNTIFVSGTSYTLGFYQIFDTRGVLLFEGQTTGKSIDVSGYGAGIYFLKIQTDNEVLSGRFIKH